MLYDEQAGDRWRVCVWSRPSDVSYGRANVVQDSVGVRRTVGVQRHEARLLGEHDEVVTVGRLRLTVRVRLRT